ncbi:hypothetical protein Acr_20g0003850 [Actinidia rufa]|uniref:Uncharacterized protein n=1 Tax=Actinidia rufa TaxID=165716 RepID=A0A7J0GCQ0_9ERIC|nr:hypothetical protein Acr_20g0003850 [Actinidia rufa]
MLEGNHYLRLRKPNQPQTRLVTDSPDKDQYLNDFIWISGQWEFPACELDPFSIPRHRGYVPDLTDASRRGVIDGHPILSPLQIRGLGLRPRSLLSDEVSNLFEGTSAELRRLLEEAKGESSGSSKSSSSSWDVNLGDEGLDEEAEVEDGEEVDQVPAAAPLVPIALVLAPEPINLPSSDSDIAIVEPREIVEHSYSHNESSSSDSQGNEEIMAPKVRTLGKGQAPRIEPPMLPEAPDSSMPVLVENQSIAPSSMEGGKQKGKQSTEGTSRQKRGKDVADHAAETTAEFGGKLVMLGAQTKSELADARSVTEIATLQRNQAQQEASNLKAFACGEVYKKLFDCAFERAGDSSSAPPIQLPASLKQYSPIILPDFNEEEYATLPANEGNINTAVAEARTGIEGTVDGDRAREAEGDRAGEAESEASVPKSSVAFKLQTGIRLVLVVWLSWPLYHLQHSPSTEVLWKSCLISRQLSTRLKRIS